MKLVSNKKRLESINDFIDSEISELSKEEIIFSILTIINSKAVNKRQLKINVDEIINIHQKYFRGTK